MINANLVISSRVAMDVCFAQFVTTSIFFKELGNFSAIKFADASAGISS